MKKYEKSCKEILKLILVKILWDWNNVLISLIFWVTQYVLHIVIILGDMPSKKEQNPQIKDLADNFVHYFIMHPPFYANSKSKRAATDGFWCQFFPHHNSKTH